MTVFRNGRSLGLRSSLWLVALVMAAFCTWFGWASFVTSRTEWIAAKVTAAITAAMEGLAPTLPRIGVRDATTEEQYYAPEPWNPQSASEVFSRVLVALNQDANLPPLKVTSVVMQNVYGSPDTTVIGQAEVEFPLVAGLYRTLHVHTSIQVPHYNTPR